MSGDMLIYLLHITSMSEKTYQICNQFCGKKYVLVPTDKAANKVDIFQRLPGFSWPAFARPSFLKIYSKLSVSKILITQIITIPTI